MKTEKTEFGKKIILPPAPPITCSLSILLHSSLPPLSTPDLSFPLSFFWKKIPLISFPYFLPSSFPSSPPFQRPRLHISAYFPTALCTHTQCLTKGRKGMATWTLRHTHTHRISEWNENRKPCVAHRHTSFYKHILTHADTLNQRQSCMYTLPEPVTVSPWRLSVAGWIGAAVRPRLQGESRTLISQQEDWLNTSCSPFLTESQTIQKYRPKPLFPFFFFFWKCSLCGCRAAFHNFSITWRSRSVAENFTPSWFVNVLLRGGKGLVLYWRCSWRDNASNLGLNKHALLNETCKELTPYIFNLNLSFTKPESPLKENKGLFYCFTRRGWTCVNIWATADHLTHKFTVLHYHHRSTWQSGSRVENSNKLLFTHCKMLHSSV